MYLCSKSSIYILTLVLYVVGEEAHLRICDAAKNRNADRKHENMHLSMTHVCIQLQN